MIRIIFSILFFIAGKSARAYPDFIGYGYTSCLTCHYSGHGGGALNDYGRALFATEIASRSLYSAKTDEEEIARQSQFLVQTELPWWIRPGIKYRGLWFQNSPGSRTDSIQKFLNMQNDINVNFFLDKEQKFSFISTATYTTYPIRFATSTGKNSAPFWFAKEFYFRYQISRNFWLYAGQLDKPFGIRHIDHTLVSRSGIGLGQFDQSQSLILHATYNEWDVAFSGFMGNSLEENRFKQKGFSITGEYELREKNRIGLSILKSKNDIVGWTRLATHSRVGLSKGSAILTELGFFENQSLTASSKPPTGVYAVVQTLAHIQRGYNLLTTLQYSKADIDKPVTEKTSFTVGALMFPMQRTEFRLSAINGQNYDESTGSKDSWQLQSQLHFSW